MLESVVTNPGLTWGNADTSVWAPSCGKRAITDSAVASLNSKAPDR